MVGFLKYVEKQADGLLVLRGVLAIHREMWYVQEAWGPAFTTK